MAHSIVYQLTMHMV